MERRRTLWSILIFSCCLVGGLRDSSTSLCQRVLADEPPATEAPPADTKPDEAKPADTKSDDSKKDDAKDSAKPAEPAAKPAGEADEATTEPKESDYELYQVFADTLDQVERNYVKKVSRRELMEAAIHGVLSKLDPYSSYISPDDLSRFKTSVESQFGGIGIQITMDRDQLKILSPLVGTPAYRAGLQSGDSILEIEGKSTEGISLDDAVRRLKGEAGTSVTLTIVHPGSVKRETVTVARELIHVETVLGDRRGDDDVWDFMLDHDRRIGYIRITAFSRDTAQDVKKAVESLKAAGLKGLVIDLRFNPGGLLTSAIEISDLFVAKGKIVSTKGRNTAERTWDAQEEGTFEGFPIAILVNRYSASASEIFSACLQDHKRAIIIGERTWGKGSVQNVVELEGGKSALKLTTASYQRPSGHNIHRFPDAKESDEWGVMPDKNFELRLSDSEMGELVRYRRDRDILIAHAKKAAEAAAAADPAKPEDKKPEDKQPEVKPEDKKPEDSKPEDPKPEDKKPTETKPEDAKVAETKQPESKPADNKFVDRQLQKALDYLTQELAAAK